MAVHDHRARLSVVGFQQHRIEIDARRHLGRQRLQGPWARPISPPSAVTAEFSAMFCGLKGATATPRRLRMRHSAATNNGLPASDVHP